MRITKLFTIGLLGVFCLVTGNAYADESGENAPPDESTHLSSSFDEMINYFFGKSDTETEAAKEVVQTKTRAKATAKRIIASNK